ncbi:MAG: DUF6804 family protein [Candidatus Staskawiczbacteria bacterium]|jgi:hypothetical protein
MNNYIKENWFKILATIILIISFGNNPYSYYQFERWAILIIGGYSAYLAYKNKDNVWAWIFAIIAILFNPIAPFYMARGTWQLFDLVAAVLFLIPTSKTKPSAEPK